MVGPVSIFLVNILTMNDEILFSILTTKTLSVLHRLKEYLAQFIMFSIIILAKHVTHVNHFYHNLFRLMLLLLL